MAKKKEEAAAAAEQPTAATIGGVGPTDPPPAPELLAQAQELPTQEQQLPTQSGDPPADDPPADDNPANAREPEAELPVEVQRLSWPGRPASLARMAEELVEWLGLESAPAAERIELAARALHEHRHIPYAEALRLLGELPPVARLVLLAQGAHEQARAFPDFVTVA